MNRKNLEAVAKRHGIDLQSLSDYMTLTRGTIINILRRETGLYKKPYCKDGKLVTPAKCVPFLVLKRPAKRDFTSGKGYENRTKWVHSLEYGPTVDKILELVERYPEEIIITYEPKTMRVIPVIKDGAITVERRPKVTGREAEKVAGNPDGRGIKEFIPHPIMMGLTKLAKKEIAIPTGRYVNLEELAEKQRAEEALKPKKPHKKPEALMAIYPQSIKA